jgi:hypothetical protein
MEQFIKSFMRAYSRGLGYQAARSTGWVAAPLLVLIILVFFGVQFGLIPPELLALVGM